MRSDPGAPEPQQSSYKGHLVPGAGWKEKQEESRSCTSVLCGRPQDGTPPLKYSPWAGSSTGAGKSRPQIYLGVLQIVRGGDRGHSGSVLAAVRESEVKVWVIRDAFLEEVSGSAAPMPGLLLWGCTGRFCHLGW